MLHNSLKRRSSRRKCAFLRTSGTLHRASHSAFRIVEPFTLATGGQITMIWTLALAFHLFQVDAASVPPANTASSSAIAEMVHNSGPVAFTVLVLLLLASIFSWTIMLSKWSSLGRADKQSKRFVRAFRKSSRLSEVAAVAEQFRPSPLVSVFSEIHDEYQRQNGGRGLPRNPVALERAAATASS